MKTIYSESNLMLHPKVRALRRKVVAALATLRAVDKIVDLHERVAARVQAEEAYKSAIAAYDKGFDRIWDSLAKHSRATL